MKFFVLLMAFVMSASTVNAQPAVTTPSDRVTAALPIPIKVDLPEGSRKQFDISIESAGTKLIQISASGSIDVYSISTRYQAFKANVSVSVASPSAPPFRTERTLDLPEPAVIPEDREESMAILGPVKYTFVRGGTEVHGRINPHKFTFVVKNAASRKHFVNEVEVELTKSGQRSILKIKGSPYWYEPLMVIEGDFDTARIIQVVAN